MRYNNVNIPYPWQKYADMLHKLSDEFGNRFMDVALSDSQPNYSKIIQKMNQLQVSQ